MRRVIAGLDSVRMYLSDENIFDSTPARHVPKHLSFASRLREHDPRVPPSKVFKGATQVMFEDDSISSSGVLSELKTVEALDRMPMPTDVPQLRSLLSRLSYHRKFLSNLVKRLRPATDRLERHMPYSSRPEIEPIIIYLLRGFRGPHV